MCEGHRLAPCEAKRPSSRVSPRKLRSQSICPRCRETVGFHRLPQAKLPGDDLGVNNPGGSRVVCPAGDDRLCGNRLDPGRWGIIDRSERKR